MKQRGFFLILITGVLLGSCKDFITKKIGNDSVTILAPANNTVTTSNMITFWWEALDGADNYNIQVVKPNFASAQVLVADTNVSGTKLQLSLTPGKYQWRIQGVNGGGGSKYTLYNLTIDSTSNLSGQLVVPLGPATGYVMGGGPITFSWNPVFSADKYEIYISTNPPTDVTLTQQAYTGTFTAGYYTWKVKAINAFSISQYNVPRGFKIDLTKPAAPNTLSVTQTSSLTAVVKDIDTLKWKRPSADVAWDSIYIYSDAGLTAISGTSLLPIAKMPINTLLSAPGSSTVPYWWRVKSIDSVGNTSNFSSTGTFTLAP